MEKQLLLVGLILSVFLISFVSAEVLVSDAGVEYETDILDALDDSEWVEVIIKIQEENDTLRDFVISNLSISEFQFKEKQLLESGFVGNISLEGLNKLINNSNVKWIYLNRIAHTLENETNYTAEVEQDVLNALDSSEWVPVIIKLYEKNDSLINSIISNLSSSEFKIKGTLSRGFAGNITQDGLDKLVNNPNVREIYLDRIVQVHNDTNDVSNETEDQEETDDKITIEEKPNLLWLWMIIGVIFIIVIYLIIKKKK